MVKGITPAALIDRVNRDPTLKREFKDGWGGVSIEAYLEEYGYMDDIVERLAGDLGVYAELTRPASGKTAPKANRRAR
jgi:hypothetical protein